MSEKLIETVVTKNDLKFALKHLGVKSSDAYLVHTAMSKLQYLPGGSETIVKAIEETLVNGTLMMPSQVSMNCDPATWEYPPVRKDLIQVIQDAMPPLQCENIYNSRSRAYARIFPQPTRCY